MVTKKAAGRTLASFRSAHDPDVKIPEAIKAGLASLLAEGVESWDYEMDFIQRCTGVATSNIGKYRHMFEKHIVVAKINGKLTKNVWFADIKVAARARGQ